MTFLNFRLQQIILGKYDTYGMQKGRREKKMVY